MRKLKRVAIASALSAGALVASTSSAVANGGWDDQFGVYTYGCYAWTTYRQYMVTPHMWQQANNNADTCWMNVTHIGYDSSWHEIYGQAWPDNGSTETTGPSTGFDGPSWYYGPWNGTGHMCVLIISGDALYDDGSRGDGGVTEYC